MLAWNSLLLWSNNFARFCRSALARWKPRYIVHWYTFYITPIHLHCFNSIHISWGTYYNVLNRLGVIRSTETSGPVIRSTTRTLGLLRQKVYQLEPSLWSSGLLHKVHYLFWREFKLYETVFQLMKLKSCKIAMLLRKTVHFSLFQHF